MVSKRRTSRDREADVSSEDLKNQKVSNGKTFRTTYRQPTYNALG